jgi:hypothetical protein
VFAGTTGLGVNTGFGYILKFTRGGSKHVIIATRGTRAEIGETWLTLYDGGHAALACLVTQVRGLDPVF